MGFFWIKISEVFLIPKGKNWGIKTITVKLNKVQQCRSIANILGSLIIWAPKVLCGSPFPALPSQNIQQYCMLRMALIHTWCCFVVTPRFCHLQYPDIATTTEVNHSPTTSIGLFSETLPLPISVKSQQHVKTPSCLQNKVRPSGSYFEMQSWSLWTTASVCWLRGNTF